MREKSKFVTFILSFLPGLSHMYLGFADRGLIFLMILFGVVVGTLSLAFLINGEIAFMLIFALPLIWLVALLDAFSLMRRYRSNIRANGEQATEYVNVDEMKESNRKTITLALSIIPGAGHMYLGLQQRGLILMAIFLFSIFFMGWLGLSLLLFLLPLIWFYSFFDAFHIVNGKDLEGEELPFILSNIKQKWIGWGLIALGILTIMERIIYPLIPYYIRNYMQTSIVSLIFIIGGIKLLAKSKEEIQKEGEEICKEDE
ncbi:MAG: hypothetical protein GXY88_06345 [Tissierellia bacterium]|nr:hypothetical protein [Tissierellia bacterium]